MKRIIPFILLAAACGAAEAKSLWTETRELVNMLRNYSVHTSTADVRAKLPAGLKYLAEHGDDITNRALVAEVEMNFARTAARAGDLAIAMPYAQRLVDDASTRVEWRLEGAYYLVQGHLLSNAFETADAIYAPFTELRPPKIKPANLARAYALRASLLSLRNDFEGATNLMAKARAESPGDEDFNESFRYAVDVETVDIYKTFHYVREAFDYCLAHGRKSMALGLVSSGTLDDIPEGIRLAREIVADSSLPPDRRLGPWLWLFSRDSETTDKYFGEMLGTTEKTTNNVIEKLSKHLSAAWLYNAYCESFPSYFGNYAEMKRTWEMLLPLLRGAGRAPDFKAAQYAAIAYAATGDMGKAMETARIGLENKWLKPEERYELELIVRTFALRGTPESIARAIEKTDHALASTNLTDAVRLSRLDRVGGIAVASRNDNLARGFAIYHGKVSHLPKKRRYVAKFSQRPVGGAEDWANLPFKPDEQPLSRQYGAEDVSFDANDADSKRAAADADTNSSPVTVQVVTDEWGIHILFTFRTEHARDYQNGLRGAGNYEGFFATGPDQPYTCFMGHANGDVQDWIFNTAYDGPGHRRVDEKNPSQFRSGKLYTDNAIFNYLGFSWDNFATYIPKNGMEWEFECLLWGPIKCAWNGMRSYHGRSTWGRLVFELTEADRLRICRIQLFKAARAYRAEKSPNPPLRNNVQGGVFDFWKDDELGDPVFYESVLKPLQERLDKGLERLKWDMPDQDIRDLTENYLEEWRDIRFTVGRLRAAYLRERLSAE